MGHGRNLRRNYINEELPEMKDNQVIARVSQVRDKGVIGIERSNEENLLISELAFLPPRFRGVLFLRRGSFVLLSPENQEDIGKIVWSIDHVLRPEDIKQLKKDEKWPSCFDNNIIDKSKEIEITDNNDEEELEAECQSD